MEFSLKFFDKTSGLTLEEVNDLFVRKDGDIMSGALKFDMPMFSGGTLSGTESISIRNESDPTQTSFTVDSLGHTVVSSLKLKAEDPAINSIKLTIDDTIDFGANHGVYESVAGKTHIFKLGGNANLTIGNNIDVHDHQIKNLKDGTLDSDAVTVSQLESLVKGSLFIDVTTSGGQSVISWKNCNIEELLNVSTNTPSDDQVLKWIQSQSKWVPRSINEFKPGERVACTDQSDLEIGGLQLSSNGDLYIRVS